MTLTLPPLPQESGGIGEFLRLTREELEAFRTQHPVFQSLLVPVKVTFLFIPPAAQGKDVDNIALAILPIVHGVLKPHIEPHPLAPTFNEDPPEPWREEALRRLRSLNTDSVTEYQVVTLPRHADDPSAGVLTLSLGRVSHMSWWDRASQYVDRVIEREERDSYFRL